MRHRHHPWRRLRAFPDWTLVFVDWLPIGRYGRTLHDQQRVELLAGLDQAERRCTLDHELDHVRHGPESVGQQWERRIDLASARRLIPLENLIEGLIWAGDDEELAEELWVDLPTLRVRLAHLTDEEDVEINRALDEAETHYPRRHEEDDQEPAC